MAMSEQRWREVRRSVVADGVFAGAVGSREKVWLEDFLIRLRVRR